MSGQTVAYVRVSSAEQNLGRQLAAVGEVERVFEDKKSGRNRQERPGLTSLLEHVRRDDTVRIASMDRLARSVVDLAQLVTGLTDRGVRVEFVKENLTFDPEVVDSMATFQLHMMGAFAQMERSISRDRQREGIDLARAKGAYLGRAKRLTPADVITARESIRNGVPKAAIARDLKCSRQVLYDALYSRGAYAPTTKPRPPLAGGAIEEQLPL